MSTHPFTIPDEFSSQLRYIDAQDTRADSEILDSLSQHQPVTSEKNIWAFWHSGVRTMPGWCLHNVLNWARLCGPSWTIRVLDTNPSSPNYFLKYVTRDQLPDAFVDGKMDGPYVGPHSADFLRGACLYTYGGVFMDVGILLIRKLDDVCWTKLEDPGTPFEVSVPLMYGTVMANHFVAARKRNPFIKRWHEIFVQLWKNRTNYNGIVADPLVSFALTMGFEESKASNYHWDFKVDPATVMGYVGQVLAWKRLCLLEDTGDGFSGTDYWSEKVLLFDALQEDWGAEATIGFSGQKLFDVLATRTNAEGDEFEEAHKMIWRLLTKSSMQKITHGKNLTLSPALGVLWELQESQGKDNEPGTFAELLRYGSVHFEQTRKEIEYVKAERPAQTLKEGLLG